MSTQPNQNSFDNYEFVSLATELMGFRQQLEAEAGEPVSAIEVNAALLLFDLCKFLGIGDAQCLRILGRQGVGYLAATLAAGVELPVLH